MTPEGAAAQTLPTWNLADLYAGPEAPEVERDLKDAGAKATAFRQQYEGKLASLSGADFLAAILAYERIQEILGRVMSFAQLLYAGDMSNTEFGRFQQNTNERATQISLETLFFTLEINKLSDADMQAKLGHAPLRRFVPWLDTVRAFRPHQLSDELEKMLHEKHVAGRQAWMRLFDETMAALRFAVDGKKLTSNEALNLLYEQDGAKRKIAADAVSKGLGDNKRVFALVTNTLAKDKEIDDKWRKFARPVSSRNLANQVEDEVVEALVSAVKANYPKLSHRYYELKASWLGLPKLDYWDRNAPLPDDDDKPIAWSEAQSLVLTAYNAFSPKLAEVGRALLRQGLDRRAAAAGQGARRLRASDGAERASLPAAELPRPHPRRDDPGARAGARRAPGAGGAAGPADGDTPLTLAETASVFGEMLTFQALLKRETDPERAQGPARRQGRGHAEHGGAPDRLARVRAPAARRAARGRADAGAGLGEIWLATQREALGDGVDLPDARAMRPTGPTSRTSSMCRSMSTPMRSAIAW